MDDIVKLSAIESGILTITLNRPEQLNSLSQAVLQRLLDIFLQAKQNNAVKGILLTGEGKAFCAGADIKQLAELDETLGLTFARFGQSVFSTLENLGKPSIAAIQGYALGGGCELAMAATLRLATNTAIFGQPEVKLGVIPGFGGTQRLSRLIGKGRALEICLTGRRFSAEEALDWGFVNELVAPEDLLNRARILLREITQHGSITMQNIIDVINQGYNLPLVQALELEVKSFSSCCSTSEKEEGVKAFLEKKKV